MEQRNNQRRVYGKPWQVNLQLESQATGGMACDFQQAGNPHAPNVGLIGAVDTSTESDVARPNRPQVEMF